MGTVARMTLAALAGTALTAWAFMILVGVIHGVWIAALPTLGFETACLVIAMIEVIVTIVVLSYLAISAIL